MKTIVGLILIVLTSTACSQKNTHIIGYYESYYSGSDLDSSFSGKVYSEEQYVSGKLIYKKQYDIWDLNCYDIEQTLNDSITYRINYCHGDSILTEFITQKSKNLRLNLKNGDTVSITDLSYSDNKIIKMKCRSGCDSDIEVSYSGDTTYYKHLSSLTYFSWEIFDDKKRLVFYALPTEDKNDYQFIKHTFDDRKRTKTSISGYKNNLYQTIKVSYDKNWIPMEKEVVVFNDGIVHMQYKILYKYL